MKSIELPITEKIDEIRNGLISLPQTIKKGILETENPFLSLGSAVNACYSDSENLIRMIKGALDNFNDASGSNLISGVENAVKHIIDTLTRHPAEINSDLRHLSDCSLHLESLCRSCSEMEDLSRYLNIIGLNIGIEAARSRETMSMFEGFTHEIKKLAADIAQITEKIQTDADRAKLSQTIGLEGVSEKTAAIGKVAESARKTVLNAMQNIRHVTDHSRKTMIEAEQTARTIQEQVGNIVMAIQFHDIVRQQLEHVTSAIEDALTLMPNPSSGVEEAADIPVKLPGRLISILRIQKEQVSQAIIEIEKAGKDIAGSLDSIGAKVKILKNLMDTSDGSLNEGGQSLSNEFEDMKTELNHLDQLRTEAGQMGSALVRAIQQSSDVVDVLSKYAGEIRSISTGIHYKALNAIIMTSKLDTKGVTLEVLAREIRNVSVACGEQVDKVLVDLNAISAQTANLSSKESKDGMADTPETTLNERILSVSAAMEAYSNDSENAAKSAENLETQISQTQQELHFLNLWGQELKEIRDLISGIIDTAVPLADAGTDKEDMDDGMLSARYTMQSERAIHERISAGDTDPAADKSKAPAPKEETVSTETEEFDDNIELF